LVDDVAGNKAHAGPWPGIGIDVGADNIPMRSKIHLKGHPLHPILVAFPIAFFTGTLIFDVLGWIYLNDTFWQTGMYMELAGIIGAALAAIPGIVDFFTIVPPESSGKKRAAKHGVLNVILLVIFVFCWYYRQDRPFDKVVVLGEAVGVVLMIISGWLGGTLVHRNQIGIDHRYAHAGKWKEKYFKDEKGQVEVGNANELKPGQLMLVHVQDKRIVIGKTEEGYVAFDDRCTHRGASLADGSMICGVVQCPWHGSQFDGKTGAVKAGPAKKAIKTYPLHESGGKLILEI
jgi:uncharacterized membrane protein/nitrite reductase/ring-hydroxylating ferredoxin subunit